jgi:hypothetical protein
MRLAAALAALALTLPALAREVAGVEFPEKMMLAGKELKLNGAGLRSKFFVKVYAGGLYLAQPASTGDAIVAADEAKRVRMVFLRDVDAKTILATYREGFEKNSGGPGLPALLKKLDEIAPAVADLKKGDEMFVTYVPGQGTTVQTSRGGAITVEGKDFADAMLRNWLGPHPADSGLEKAFLGK